MLSIVPGWAADAQPRGVERVEVRNARGPAVTHRPRCCFLTDCSRLSMRRLIVWSSKNSSRNTSKNNCEFLHLEFYTMFVTIFPGILIFSHLHRCSTKIRITLRFPENFPIFPKNQTFRITKMESGHVIHRPDGLQFFPS